MTRHAKLLATAAALALWAGTASAQDTLLLRVVFNADIRSTDPGVNRDSNTDTVMLHVVEGLTGLREGGEVGLMLADTMEVSEDGTRYVFTLREGVPFHNGEILTAEDVVWTWNRYLDPEVEFRCGDDFREGGAAAIESVEATGEMEVTFTLESPNALFPMIMSRPDCASTGIYHSASVNADGEWVEPIGTGPFTISEWRRDEFIELSAFADYAARDGEVDGLVGNKTPLVDTVRILIVPDEAAAKAALVADDADILPDIGVDDQAELSGVDGIALETSPTMAANGLLFQTTDEVMSNQALRRAIALSMDAPAIVNAITGGAVAPNYSAVPAASSFHGPVQAEGYSRDLEQARALLEEAGYDGTPITMMTTQDYQSMYDIAIYAQAMAAEAGIEMELEVVEWATLLDAYLEGDYQVMAFGYSARLDPALSYDMFMGDKSEEPRKVWDDPEAQALLARAIEEGDPAVRQELFDALHRKHIDSVTFMNFYEWPSIAATRADVEGFRLWGAAKPRFWGVSVGG
jgi:peptide/nickel transport system substrate-binding protein